MTHAAILPFVLLGGCSKTDVNVSVPPSSEPGLPIVTTSTTTTSQKTTSAAERLVEIDRLLATPPSGRPEDSDRRVLLRSERAALIASGQLPYHPPSRTVAEASTSYHSAPVSYAAAAPPMNDHIVVAPNSQASNLPALEQMTPTERKHYYEALRLHNTGRLEVDVYHRH